MKTIELAGYRQPAENRFSFARFQQRHFLAQARLAVSVFQISQRQMDQ